MNVNMLFTTLILTATSGSAFANQPPPPRMFSMMKLEAVLATVPETVALPERVLGAYTLPQNQYLLEKLDADGLCVPMVFDLQFIPHEIPGFFSIKAVLAPDQSGHICKLND